MVISMNNRNGLGMSYHLMGIFESVAPCNRVRLAQLCTMMHTCIVSGACVVVVCMCVCVKVKSDTLHPHVLHENLKKLFA